MPPSLNPALCVDNVKLGKGGRCDAIFWRYILHLLEKRSGVFCEKFHVENYLWYGGTLVYNFSWKTIQYFL